MFIKFCGGQQNINDRGNRYYVGHVDGRIQFVYPPIFKMH